MLMAKLQDRFFKRSVEAPQLPAFGIVVACYIELLSHRQKSSSGFTLLEILIAIFILGILMALILGTFTGIISGSTLAENKIELHQIGRTLIELISADFRGIFTQAAEQNDIFFIGLKESIEGKSMSRMEFITTNALEIGNLKNPYMSEVGYGVKKNPNNNFYSLWRRSQSPSVPPHDEGGREVPICRIVENFGLEFLTSHGRQEVLIDQIPHGVIISITLTLDGERETFRTMVRPMITL